MPEPHKFREFFTLIANPNNKSNAKAVCNYCSAKHGGVQAAALISGCSVTNKANLCRNHLANCNNFKEAFIEEEVAEILSRAVPEDKRKLDNATSSSNKQITLTSFYRRPMSSKDTPTFEALVVKMCISNGLPFSFVENEETQAVFNFVAPGLKLPNRKKLGGKLLLNTSDNFQKNILKIAQSDEFGLTATFDGWTNVKQENIWGVVLITSKDVMRHIEQLIDETENKNIYIKAFISDSAGEYAAARRQLRRKYPARIFLPCMAHQMNLVFGDIFKENEIFKRISKEAIRIVSFFHNSTYFTGNLRDEQKRIYNKTIQLISPGDTRWNSYYFCFHSLLKTQAALKFLSAKFNPDRTNINCTNGIPSITANKKSKRSNGERKLPDDIADSINDAEFCKSLFSLQNLLYPLCGFLNKLQKDTARLYEVVHCFAYTTKIFSEYYEPEFSEKMVLRMESRWKDWEQPLLLLSIALHPSYKLSKFRSTVNNLTWTHIGQWLKYYYFAFFGTSAKTILSELIDYKRGDDPYDDDSFLQFRGNVLNFWESTMGIGQELAKVAIRIHSICVNSASHKKVLAMSQIRSDILYQRQIKEVNQADQQMKRLHIATPIASDDLDYLNDEPLQNIDEEFLIVSDDEDVNNAIEKDIVDEEEPSTEENENQWSSIISQWIEEANFETGLKIVIMKTF
ncbi:unnamed protein product [Rhizophagus irregularis]|nr:unnamed protein product [Rhizophagus irregularis]